MLLAPAVWVRADEPHPPFGEEVTVVGERPRATAAGDPTAAATVVDATRFAGEAKTVAELVGTSPGVAINQYGGLGQLATVSIRGSTADQVQVFLDGLPLNTAAGGGVDLSRIPRSWIERIEVVRGAEGARYGSGALGGVVNIVTRPAAAGTWSAETTAGSFQTYGASMDGAIGGERWGLLGAASLDDTSGRFGYLFDPRPTLGGGPLEERERDHNASLTAGGLLKGWAAVGSGRVDAALHVSGGSRDLPGSPYTFTPHDGQDDARVALTARWIASLGETLHLTVNAALRQDDLNVRIAPFPETRQRDRAAQVETDLLWSAGPHEVTAGVLVGTERLDATGVGEGRQTVALILADDLTLAGGRLRLGPALRWERVGPYQGLSGSLGGVLKLAGPLSLRASAGHTYRVPSFDELYLQQGLVAPNPDLVPEEGWSADASLVAQGRAGFASLGGFGTLYRDLVVYEAASFGRMKPFNDGKALAYGAEAEAASARVGPLGLGVEGAYTLLFTETLRGTEAVLGRELPHRARHRLFARASVAPDPVELHLEAQYISSQFLDLENLLPVPPAFTVNLGGSLRVLRHPDLRLHLDLRNLLDDRTIQDGFGNPLPGRMVLLTLRVSGGKEEATR